MEPELPFPMVCGQRMLFIFDRGGAVEFFRICNCHLFSFRRYRFYFITALSITAKERDTTYAANPRQQLKIDRESYTGILSNRSNLGFCRFGGKRRFLYMQW